MANTLEMSEKEQALRLTDILKELDETGRRKLLNVGEIMVALKGLDQTTETKQERKHSSSSKSSKVTI